MTGTLAYRWRRAQVLLPAKGPRRNMQAISWKTLLFLISLHQRGTTD
ncbi:hypothetical protein SynA1528_01668 [Synechococcus sp. A15-28]|nr:hypothetical protein SynA1528_01668 [Synechococcus sp. A15-28]